MASTCSFGVSNTQLLSSKLNHKSSNCMTFVPWLIQAGNRQKAWRHSDMMLSQASKKSSTICCAQSSLATQCEPVASRSKDCEEKSYSTHVSQLIPNSHEVNSLLTEICDTTSIAEFELNLNGFHLHVTRDLSGNIGSPLPLPASPSSVSSSSNTAANEPASVTSESTSLAITRALPSEIISGTLLERAADEGLVIIQSPKVGFFRRCRIIKGKRAPPACKEKQIVKEGQVICYIEQLGWQAPVESDVSGEVTRVLCEDGDAVGYGDPIVAILPSFPGIKKLSAEN